MDDTREPEEEERPRAGGRLFSSLVRLLGGVADTAVQSLRLRAVSALDAYRGEMRRLLVLWLVSRAILLFVWTGVVFGALAIVVVFGTGHRLAGLLSAAGACLLIALIAGLLANRIR